MTASRHPAMALDAETLLQHSAWLARFARALVANESELDDVVQQTYAQALAQPPRHARNLRGWLGAIARNVVRTRARSDSARVAREVALPPPPPVETPDQAVERAELRRSVVEAVLALNEPYRSTVILRFFEEQEVAAIARLTRTGEDTVRTRLRRGVARVRELLERRVVDEKPGAADEGAAARALLYLHLREIAASAGSPAGAGGGGATGSAAASRSLVREGGRRVATATTRRILVGAATVVVASGGFWWWKETHVAPPQPEPAVASRPSAGVDSSGRDASTPPAVVAERSTEAPPKSTQAPTVPPVPVSRPRKAAAFRGIVSDPDGKPDPSAYVWAIASPNHEPVDKLPGFAFKASQEIQRDPTGQGHGSWLAADRDDEGHYEITGLPLAAGWVLGAFDPDVGAVLTDVYSLDREHNEVEVELKLVHGMKLRGQVVDEKGTPIGNVELALLTNAQKTVIRTDGLTQPLGEDVGVFDFGFRCGDSLEMECRAPGFVPPARRKIEFEPNATRADVKVTLEHQPGTIVRGRLVDAAGKPLELEKVLNERLLSIAPLARFTKVSLRAIPDASASKLPTTGASSEDGIVEGRVDYEEEMYEVVVAAEFRGSLEMRITDTLVGTALLADPGHPPDLPVDAERIPKSGASMKYFVRFVDADSKEPIDLGTGPAPLQASYRASTLARLRADSDPQHGVISFGCEPGTLTVRTLIPGYAPGVFDLVVAEGAQKSIPSLEIPRAGAGVRGVVFHADGRPFAKTAITLYRVTREGLNDTTSNDIVTNPDGEFEFSSIAKGEHVLVASGTDSEACGVTRFVASDPFPEIEVHCTTGSATRIRIDATPQPGDPPDTRLRILDRDGVIVGNVHRGWIPAKRALDEFTTALRDGHYTAVVGRDGYRDNSIEFDVPARGAIDILLVPLESHSK